MPTFFDLLTMPKEETMGARLIAEVRQFLGRQVQWLGQSGFLIATQGGKTLYIDPFFLPPNPPQADVIFLTHSHGDHCNPRALARIRTPQTQVIATPDLASLATKVVAVGEEFTVDGVGVGVKTFAAYNGRGFPHPRSKGWVGYRIDVDGFQVYHAGDTDSGTEIAGMRPDLAFLPLAAFVTFGLKAGVEAALGVGATLTAPIHYGLIPGTKKNGEKFVQAYPGESALLTKTF